MHRELQRHKGVTLRLLWLEYRTVHPNGYQYSRFCDRYRAWRGRLDVVMRQVYRAGEKAFVDYAGPKFEVVDRSTGEACDAMVFVGVLGASNYTFVDVTWSRALPDWVMSHVRTFEFWGGVPELVIPDNEKAGVRKASRYEPDLNPTYQELATHYGTTVLPARPRAPQDKAKVEAAVQNVERWIMAPLRNQTFFSLGELREAIAPLLAALNERPFQKTEGSRRSWFEDLDRPALKPLPAQRYEYAEWRKARVNIDYHIQVEHALYSVPYPLARSEVDVRLSATTVEIFHKHRRVAAHLRIRRKGGYATEPVAHAGSPPRPCGMDTVAAHRLGPQGRTAHGRVRRTAPREPAPPRTGLPQLPRTHEAAARLLRRTPGGRLPPRAGHRHAELRVRQVHPRDRPGPGRQRRATHALPARRARPHPRAGVLHQLPKRKGVLTLMLRQPTLDLLHELRLAGMAQAFEEQAAMPDISELSFEDRLSLLLEREKTDRAQRRYQRLKGHAKLHLDATIEDLNFKAPRGLDRSLVLRLASGQWIRDGQTVLVAGATGSGKSYLACAFGHQACRLGISTRYYRVSRLLDELTLARGDGSYPKLIQRLARTWLLILDDWGLASLSGQGRHDLLEVLDDRYARRGTLLASQVPVEHRHDVVGDPTFGDAILDRLLNNAHRITLKGGSMRRLYDSTKAVHNTPGHA